MTRGPKNIILALTPIFTAIPQNAEFPWWLLAPRDTSSAVSQLACSGKVRKCLMHTCLHRHHTSYTIPQQLQSNQSLIIIITFKTSEAPHSQGHFYYSFITYFF